MNAAELELRGEITVVFKVVGMKGDGQEVWSGLEGEGFREFLGEVTGLV